MSLEDSSIVQGSTVLYSVTTYDAVDRERQMSDAYRVGEAPVRPEVSVTVSILETRRTSPGVPTFVANTRSDTKRHPLFSKRSYQPSRAYGIIYYSA